ncbi:ParB N-terminal domain-containing protein [Kitasatospora sp. NPDC085464]|uniref:ParB N-terminal domain-containing protein n=1 Tax=Kitasatospora sp. NPDC085464 TaxID=3364063 RepID=UPI0037CABB13
MAVEYVETRAVPLRDLSPYPGNAKRGDVPAIQQSLRKTGQYRSLVVRDTGSALIVLAGNHTLQALKANGEKTARCEVITCTDADARRINLADNRLSELGTFDDDALAELLQAMADDGGLDGTGYTTADLDQLLADDDAATSAAIEGDADQGDDDHGLWGVIVTCANEDEQVELLDRLSAEGRHVRALIT